MDVKIIVVFDGKGETDINRFVNGKIEILFSDTGNTADEVICQLCQKYSHAKDTIVVSSDREIINCTKKNHLISKTSRFFVREIEDIILRVRDDDEYLSPVDLDDWLKYFNKNKP